MTERHDAGPGPTSSVRYGALLSALVAVIVAVSTVIYVGVAGTSGDIRQEAVAGPHPSPNAAPAMTGSWVTTWAAAPTGGEPGTESTGLADRSVRNVVHTSVGGSSARITLSNRYGRQPLAIAHASVALAAAPGTPVAAAGTLRRLTFDGATSVLIPAGGQRLSDAVPLVVPPDADLLVSTYAPAPAGPVTVHAHARQMSYVASGERTEDPSGAGYTRQSEVWRHLCALDVLSSETDGTVVAFGDSLTDGITSTRGANHRWTDVLAARLRDETGAPRYAVANEGISGNRILADGPGRPPANLSGLARFQHDALDRSGVRVVVIALGVNDILHGGTGVNAVRVLGGLRELTRQARARGVRVVGATLMPFGGHPGAQPRLEDVRRTVNAGIRAGHVFDAVIDFDGAVRDRYDPRRLNPAYDSGDHLHPNDLGYRAMAYAVNLADLRGPSAARL